MFMSGEASILPGKRREARCRESYCVSGSFLIGAPRWCYNRGESGKQGALAWSNGKP